MLLKIIFAEKNVVKRMLSNYVYENGNIWLLMYVRNHILENLQQHNSILDWFWITNALFTLKPLWQGTTKPMLNTWTSLCIILNSTFDSDCFDT